MSMIYQAGIIVRDVAKGLASILQHEKPSEYLLLHRCDRCSQEHPYHMAGTAPDGFPRTPRKEYVPREIPGTHYCEKCGRYHKAK